jgi:hypothetical protein
VEVKSLKKGLKFYLKSRNYTQKELLDIISSIKNDQSKSEAVANKLIDNILSKNVANDEIEIYKDKLKHRDRKINLPRISNGANAFISSLEEICDKEDIISFKLYSSSGIECFARNKDFRNKEAVFKGIIYRVIDVGSRTKVVIYLPEDKNAIIIPIENIYIIGRKQNPSKKPISFVLSIKNKDVLLSKWIEDFYSGQTGVTLDFVLQMDTVIGSDMHKKMKKSFCNYYKNTNYEFFRKTIKVEANTDFSYEVECVKLKSNLESFLNWYNDLKVIHSFIILEPKDLNDTYFSKLIKLFAQRVNKYGENTYVTYETGYKKEFLDNLERRMDNIKNKFKK